MRRCHGRIAGRADVSGAQQRLSKDTSTAWALHRAYPSGEEPIGAHPFEATGENMEEKPSEACDGVQRHRALPIPPLRVLPSERHLPIGAGEQPPMGDRYPMGVTCQGAEDLVRPGQWGLGVDHPLHALHGQKALVPDRWGGPPLARALHAEGILSGRLPQRRQERAPAETAEETYREKEAFGTWAPGGAIQRQPPCGDQTMDVGMMVQGLTPGRQDPEKAALGSHMRWVTRDGLEGLGHGLEQQGLPDTRMLEGEGTARSRKGKNPMAGGDVQEFPLAGGQPGGLGTALTRGAGPIVAGVLTALLMPAVVARARMASQHGGAAWPDRVEDAAVRRRGHRPLAGQRRRPIRLDDVGDFQPRAGHGWESEGAGCGNNASGLGMVARACGLTGS